MIFMIEEIDFLWPSIMELVPLWFYASQSEVKRAFKFIQSASHFKGFDPLGQFTNLSSKIKVWPTFENNFVDREKNG